MSSATTGSPRRVGFLGPRGTFTEEALNTLTELAGMERVLYRTMPDVLDAVETGEVDLGFVAIENSIEGTVNLTQDELAFNHDLLIQGEVVLDIEHCLMAKRGTAPEDVTVVLSIPVASAQCHAFLRSMVRVLVGTMLEVSSSRRSVASFTELLAGAPRSQAGETAPPHGLYLESVGYGDVPGPGGQGT